MVQAEAEGRDPAAVKIRAKAKASMPCEVCKGEQGRECSVCSGSGWRIEQGADASAVEQDEDGDNLPADLWDNVGEVVQLALGAERHGLLEYLQILGPMADGSARELTDKGLHAVTVFTSELERLDAVEQAREWHRARQK